MATYRQLLSEKDFLKVAVRARAISSGTNLFAIYYSENTLYFKTRSATDPNLVYTQRIELCDMSYEKLLEVRSFRDVEKLVKDGNIKVDCNCPAFLYWGFKYKAWKHGYGLEKETRRPIFRNPFERGYVCKHLYLVLQVFPYMSKAIASKFYYWSRKKEGLEENRVSNYFGKYKVNTTLENNEKVTLPNTKQNPPQETQGQDI